jgi:hypothetical protein
MVTLNKDGTGKTFNDSIIDKYLQVIRELDPKQVIFKDVNLDEGAGDPEILLSEPHRSVIYGFACHVNLEEDKNKKERETARFEQITGAFKIAAILKKGLPCPPIPAIPVRPAMPGSPTN